MVDPVIEPLADILSRHFPEPSAPSLRLHPVGTLDNGREATDPLYWARHCRETVRYAAALASLFETESPILLEAGPGRTLASLARQSAAARRAPLITASLPDFAEISEADVIFLDTLGDLWAAGVTPDWRALHAACPAAARQPAYLSIPAAALFY